MPEADPRQIQRESADRQLGRLEAALQRVVAAALEQVARDFAAQVKAGAADQPAVTAAIDDALLRGLTTLWAGHARSVLLAVVRIYQAAAQWVWRRFTTEPPPPDIQNLPQRWLQDPFSVPDRVREYMEAAENRLAGVGDRLWEAARNELTESTLEGEGIDQLARRLQAVFAADGSQLGRARAERIARTETCMVWNRAVLDQALALPEARRPLYKTFLATADTRTRQDHWAADGQTVPITAPFVVGGVPMAYPGDPIAPAEQIVNCRCTLVLGWEPEPPPDDGRQYLDDAEIAEVIDFFEEQGIVRDAHQQSPGQPDLSAASGGPYTGGMIALVPSQADIERLAVDGGELPRDLHLTLMFLGKGADVPAQARQTLVDELALVAGQRGPVSAEAFALSMFNPSGEEPCWVLGVGGASLQEMHLAALAATAAASGDGWSPPEQHAPWVPHVTLTYTSDLAVAEQLVDRVGPIVFDRIRVAVGDDVTDLLLRTEEDEVPAPEQAQSGPPPRRWSTPGDTAIAFENQQTGDGRVFAPGALYWENGPWPLQYADEMLGGHEGAELAGAIEEMDRDGDRIPAAGVLYPGQSSGASAIRLLEENAPLGISVDLDDVDIEFLDARPAEEREQDEDVALLASLASASVLRLADGRCRVRASHVVDWTASAGQDGQPGGQVRATHTVEWTTTPGGRVAATGLRALAAAGAITAAAGDTDQPDGEVLFGESSGDYLMRITRGRVRGATLVAVPAFAGARIVLEPEDATAAGCPPPAGRMRDVITYIAGSPIPVSAADVSAALGIPAAAARDHLARATEAGHIRRLSRGLYVGASTLPEGEQAAVAAAMSGDVGLPVHGDRDASWDGDAAASRVLAWATGDDDQVDASRLGEAFLWRDPDGDPATLSAYRLGHADVFDGRLEIVAAGVYAVAGALQGARGGVDIPADEQEALRGRVSGLYERLAEAFDDPALRAPWDDEPADDDGEGDELVASAWQQFQDLPALPRQWFAEPTPEELPPDSGGVHIRNGRIYGWVAQAGVPHEAFPGRQLTIESLGDIDLSTFLRSKFQLDDGSVVKVGAMTMNAGHHRDGAECETAACQWDDTRTVAGIVTVGMNAGGMWFSGAAAPWLSQWDQMVFGACQPSYHVRQLPSGRWSLRAVLSVPVPGHPSRLAAAAVVDRSNMALAATARPPGAHRPGGELSMLAAQVVDELERRASIRAEIAQMAEEMASARAAVAASLKARVTQEV